MEKYFDILDIGNFKCITDYVYGGVGKYQEIKGIVNIEEACELLKKHNTATGKKVVHCDIDMDGLGSGYIYKRFNQVLYSRNTTQYIINQSRLHGIDAEKVGKINALNPSLVVILDSSSNLIDLIKQFTCDVIVVDHHILNKETKTQLIGNTAGGRYVIVTNMLDTSMPENETSHMSGGMVLYALLYEFNKRYRIMDNFHELKLEQWVGATLFTDVIPTLNDRNQYYINQLIGGKDMEPTLEILMQAVKGQSMSKYLLNFKIAPLVNSAVRAGNTMDALKTVLYEPGMIVDLKEFKERQDKILEQAQASPVEYQTFILADMSSMNIPRGYAGVIASRLGDTYGNKCVFVYEEIDGLCKGSFRGAIPHYDYRGVLESVGCFAQGHKGAFGLHIPKDYVVACMSYACIENKEQDNYFLSCGNKQGGIYHIDNVKEFKLSGNLVKLAGVNARSTGKDELRIIYSGDITFKGTQFWGAKEVYLYDIESFDCFSFTQLDPSKEIMLYAEFKDGVGIQAKNVK